MHGRRYLFLSEDRGPDPTIGTTPRVNSTLWVLSDGGQFEAVQSIATDGAHAAEAFRAGGEWWLAIANFGDRLGAPKHGIKPRYEAQSPLLRWDSARGVFVPVAEVKTQGATDLEHFHLDGQDFLAVANEGNVQGRQHQTSVIFRLDPGCVDAAHNRP